MDVAEFDNFAEEYLAMHAENIRISGEDPDYFARYKIEEIQRRWRGLNLAEPRAVLDFGSGIGNAWPFLAQAFPAADISGLDVSQKSLAIAERRFPGTVKPLLYDGGVIPLADAGQDLIFSSCVFHHIDHVDHVRLFRELKRVLKPSGRLMIFEHNPVNPVTRHIVATCPFDVNAVLISAGRFRKTQLQAGFRRVDVAYTGFFPGALAALRPLERFMTALPVGAQYYTVAQI